MSTSLWESICKQWPLSQMPLKSPDSFGVMIREYQVELLECCISEDTRDQSVAFLNNASAYAFVQHTTTSQEDVVDKSIDKKNDNQQQKQQVLPSPPASPTDTCTDKHSDVLLILDDIRVAYCWFIGTKKQLPIPQVLQLIKEVDVKGSLKATKASIAPIAVERVHHIKPKNGTMSHSGKVFELQIYPSHVLLYLLPKRRSSLLFNCCPSSRQSADDSKRSLLFEWALDEDYDLFAYPTFPRTLEIRLFSKQCVLLVDCPSKQVRDGLCAFKTSKKLSNLSIQPRMNTVKVARKDCKWLKLLGEDSIPCMAYRFSRGVHGSGLSCLMNARLIKNCARPYLALVINREETGTLLIQMRLATLIDFNAIHQKPMATNNDKRTFHPRLIVGGVNESKGEPEMWTFKFTCAADLEAVDRIYRLWVKRLGTEDNEDGQAFLDTMTGVDGKQPKMGAVVVNNRDASMCMQVYSDFSSARYVVVGHTNTERESGGGVYRVQYKLFDTEGTMLEGFVEVADAEAYRNLKVYTSRFILQNDPRMVSKKALEWLKSSQI